MDRTLIQILKEEVKIAVYEAMAEVFEGIAKKQEVQPRQTGMTKKEPYAQKVREELQNSFFSDNGSFSTQKYMENEVSSGIISELLEETKVSPMDIADPEFDGIGLGTSEQSDALAKKLFG